MLANMGLQVWVFFRANRPNVPYLQNDFMKDSPVVAFGAIKR
jgi:hypothetical protein